MEGRSLALVPGFETEPPEAAVGKRDLEGEAAFRDGRYVLVDRARVWRDLVERGVGRRVEDAEHNALILGRRQLLGREREHGEDQDSDHDPGRIDGPAVSERDIE